MYKAEVERRLCADVYRSLAIGGQLREQVVCDVLVKSGCQP